MEHGKDLARRYRCEFVDLKNFHIQHELFRKIPVDLMFRYNFVPLRRQPDGRLVIAIADPSQLMMIDEIGLLLGRRIITKVATLSQISDILKKTEQSQRVLEEASEGFALDVIAEDENSDETISIEKLTGETDISPIIRLVDTTIFTALQRRASDIHIETRDDSVVIKYRIDGVLQQAMQPIAKEHHSTIISRIKVMSELDISERRVPQDGRFRVRYNGRSIDFRVSIMPSIHGEDAVLRVLDKESMSEKFHKLTLDVVGFGEEDLHKFRRYIKEPYGMVLVTGPTGSGKTTTLYAALNEIKSRRRQADHHRRPGRIPDSRHHADSGEREERSDLRSRPALDSASRSRQDHGGRNPRHRNRADRHQRRAHRTPGVHHRSRQQRGRRARPLPEHGRRGVQLCFVVELHSGAAAGAADLRVLQERGAVLAGRIGSQRHGSAKNGRTFRSTKAKAASSARAPDSAGRTAIHELLELTDNVREMILAKTSSSEIRRAAREEGMHFLRESALDRVRRGLTTLKEINKVTFIETTR